MTWTNALRALARRGAAQLVGLICACTACAAETDTGAHGDATLGPALVSQRVNAVVRRHSQQLLYLDTEHQSFVTTPEHPFATVDSGWVPARDLAPGDRLISAKFGSLRVSSVRIEAQAQPVPVFNLGVDRSHAYLVGNADVLVHNTKCGDGEDNVTRKTRAIEETKRELDALKDPASTSSEQPLERQKRIDELEAELKKLNRQLTFAKYKAKVRGKRERKQAPPREDNSTRKSRELDEARRELDLLEKTEITSRKQALELKKKIGEQKSKIKRLYSTFQTAKYREQKLTHPELIDREQHKVLRGEDLRSALAAAQAELDERQRERTESGDPTRAPGPRETELKKRIREHTFDLEKDDELRDLENELAKLEEVASSSHEPRPELESEKQKLKDLIKRNKIRETKRRSRRKGQEDPESAAKVREHDRARRKRNRVGENSGDSHDDQLAALDGLPSSPGRDWRMKHTKAHLERLKRLAELRTKLQLVHTNQSAVRKRRTILVQNGRDTKTADDNKLAALGRKRKELDANQPVVRKRRTVLNTKTAADDRLAALDRKRKELLQQIAMERAREILDGLDEEHLDTQRDEDTELFDQEGWDKLLYAFENEQGARQEQLQQRTHDVDEETRLLDEILQSMLSPPRVEEVHSSLARLRGELSDERAQFEANNFALTNEYAFLNETHGHASTSRGHDAARRMAEIQAQLVELRVTWQERMQTRLDETQRQLRNMQGSTTFRDETIEAELAQQIALLEHELTNPTF